MVRVVHIYSMCVHKCVIWCHLSVKVYTRRLRKNIIFSFLKKEKKLLWLHHCRQTSCSSNRNTLKVKAVTLNTDIDLKQCTSTSLLLFIVFFESVLHQRRGGWNILQEQRIVCRRRVSSKGGAQRLL